MIRHRRTALALTTVALMLSACRRDDITVQRVPKDAPAPAMPMAAGGAEQLSAAPSSGATWTAPDGWKRLAPSQMRVGSYSVPTATDPIDISIVPLAGEAGGDLANINRWRGQLGLPALDEATVASVTRRQKVGAHDGLVVEFASADAKAKRLLAVMIVHDGVTWFFKAVGPDADVKKLRPDFLRFAGSLRFEHTHE